MHPNPNPNPNPDLVEGERVVALGGLAQAEDGEAAVVDGDLRVRVGVGVRVRVRMVDGGEAAVVVGDLGGLGSELGFGLGLGSG